MFGRKTTPEPTLSAPRPTPHTITGAQPEEHARLCADLGIPEHPTLFAYCRAHGIPVYDRDEVGKYLRKIFSERWVWRPVRPSDQSQGDLGYHGGHLETKGAVLYDKPIPFPVLCRMRDVLTVFPTAQFYISDQTRAGDFVGDPFLLAVQGAEQVVIEQWDEPGFNRKEAGC